MQLPLNRKLLILSFLAAAFFAFLGAPLHQGRFYIHGEDGSPENRESVLEILQQAEQLLSDLFNYVPMENFDIIILDGVWEMRSAFGLGPWIGAYYKDFKSYLQPIEVLKKREILERIVFIEYAHYFFDSYTTNKCPAWFNEMCSFFLYLYVTAESLDRQPAEFKFTSLHDFTDLAFNLKSADRMHAFYNYSVWFHLFLKTEYDIIAFSHLLPIMHEGASLEESVRQSTGKSLQVIFEEEFLPWLASK
jgi:hypothetical protein